MKIILITLLALVCIVTVSANPLITSVYYNPPGPDAGQEYVELYNPTNTTISLLNYSVQKGNGAKEHDWTTVWVSDNTTLAPFSYYLLGDVTAADVSIKLGLQNGPDAVRLVLHDYSIDTIGYGNHTYSEYYWGESTALDEFPLVRKQLNGTYKTTYNNLLDFEYEEYTPHNSSYTAIQEKNKQTNISYSFIIPSHPSMQLLLLHADTSIARGHQLVILNEINLTFQILSNDVFGSATVQLVFNKRIIHNRTIQLTSNKTIFSETVHSSFAPGVYTLFVTSRDVVANYSFTIQPTVGVEVSQQRLLFTLMNKTLHTTTMVRNSGNTPISIFALDATGFLQGLESNVTYLHPGERRNVTLTALTNVTAGAYEGTIQFLARSQ
ncbi:MAG: hypothetical protein ACI8Y7_000942 [Candidatus Woesearchaeota archaeon]|jgi:hypothetical protein